MSNRTLPIISTGEIRDQRRHIQIFNALVGHWNTLTTEDVEGIETIKRISTGSTVLNYASGVPSTLPNGWPILVQTFTDPNVELNSIISFMPKTGGPMPVETWLHDIGPGTFAIGWLENAYTAYCNYLTTKVPHTITTTETVIPIENVVLESNFSMVGDLITVDFTNVYEIILNLILDDVDSNGEITVRMRINGDSAGQEGIGISTDNQTTVQTLAFVYALVLNAGDTLDFTIERTGGGGSYAAEIETMTVMLRNLVGGNQVWGSVPIDYTVTTPL